MCGIVGYIGNKDTVDVLISGLKRLEYRGYDSAGIALIDDKELYIGSEIEALRQNLENQNKRELIESNCLNLLAKIKDLRSRNKSAYLEILKMERFLNIMRNTNDRRIVEQAKNYLRGLNEIKKGFLAQTKQAKRNVKVLNAILKSKD